MGAAAPTRRGGECLQIQTQIAAHWPWDVEAKQDVLCGGSWAVGRHVPELYSAYLRLLCCRLTLPVPLARATPTSRVSFRRNNRAPLWAPCYHVCPLRCPDINRSLITYRTMSNETTSQTLWRHTSWWAPKEFHLFRKQSRTNMARQRQIKDTYLKWPLMELQKQLHRLTEVLNKCGHLLNKGGGVDVSTELVTMQRLLPIPRERSDKLMNYWKHRGQWTKSESYASQSLLQPICSQTTPPPSKIDSLLTQPDSLCEGERKW